MSGRFHFQSHGLIFFVIFLALQTVAILLPAFILLQTDGHFAFLFLATLIPGLSLIWLRQISGPAIWISCAIAVCFEAFILWLLMSLNLESLSGEFFSVFGWPGLLFSAGMAVFLSTVGSIGVRYRRAHDALEFRRLPRTLDEKKRLFEQREIFAPEGVSEFRHEQLLSACTGFIAEQSGEILASVQMIVKNQDRYFFDLLYSDPMVAVRLLLYSWKLSSLIGGNVFFLSGKPESSYLLPLNDEIRTFLKESGFEQLLQTPPGGLDHLYFIEKLEFYPFREPLEIWKSTFH